MPSKYQVRRAALNTRILAAVLTLGAAPCGIAWCAASPASAATYTVSTIAVPGAKNTGVLGMTQSGLYYGFYTTPANADLHTYTQSHGVFSTFDIGNPQVAGFRANNTGDIVGDEVFGPISYRFKIHAGRLVQFPHTGGVIVALNSRGDMLERDTNRTNNHFFGIQQLVGQRRTIIRAPGAANTVVYGMNDEGLAYGVDYQSHRNGGGDFGFTYATGQVTQIVPPGFAQSLVSGVNNAGQLAATGISGTSTASFIETGSTFVPVAMPGAVATGISGLNDSGAAFGAYQTADQKYHAFVFKAGTYTQVALPPNAAFTLISMDNAGNLVGSLTQNGIETPFYAACSGSGC